MAKLTGSGGNIVDMLLKDYQLGKTIGLGSTGKVKHAQHKLTGHEVAIKILNRQKIEKMDLEEQVRNEIKLMRCLRHPHTVQLYDLIETPTHIYIVMEYVNLKFGALFDYIELRGRLQEDEARRLFQQIIFGVEYCHSNMVVHRDLKCENVLLDSELNVKIAGFGFGNIMSDGHFLEKSCGVPSYDAPEIIFGKLNAGPEVDIWSCGVILYAILCGSLPFDDESIHILRTKIMNGLYSFPTCLSPSARDLIGRMLVVDPMKRITISQIRQHPWFQVQLPRNPGVKSTDAIQQSEKIDEDIQQKVVTQPNDYATTSLENLGECKNYQTMYIGPRIPNDGKWALGLQSKSNLGEIMTEILEVLQELNVCWKKIGHYNMNCRLEPDNNPSHCHQPTHGWWQWFNLCSEGECY